MYEAASVTHIELADGGELSYSPQYFQVEVSDRLLKRAPDRHRLGADASLRAPGKVHDQVDRRVGVPVLRSDAAGGALGPGQATDPRGPRAPCIRVSSGQF